MDAQLNGREGLRRFAHIAAQTRQRGGASNDVPLRARSPRADAINAYFRNPLGNALIVANLLMTARAVVQGSMLERRYGGCFSGSGLRWVGLDMAEALVGGVVALLSAPSWLVVNIVCAVGSPILHLLDAWTRVDLGMALFVVASSFQCLAIGNAWPSLVKRIREMHLRDSTPASIATKSGSPALPMLDAASVVPLGSPLEEIFRDARSLVSRPYAVKDMREAPCPRD